MFSRIKVGERDPNYKIIFGIVLFVNCDIYEIICSTKWQAASSKQQASKQQAATILESL